MSKPAVAELERVVQQAKAAYYNTQALAVVNLGKDYPLAYRVLVSRFPSYTQLSGKTEITDALYDDLESLLRELAPRSSVLAVGAPVAKTAKKVKLPYYMGSLLKVTPDTVEKWLAKYSGPYVVSDKLDGISLSVDYADTPTKAYKRGNGSIGQDITHLLPCFNLPHLTKKLAVRCEILIPQAVFQKKWATEFENSRAMMSGLTNRKLPHPGFADVDVVAYEVLTPSTKCPSENLTRLHKLGFKVVQHRIFATLTVKQLQAYYAQRKQQSPYDLDGLVIRQDRPYMRTTEGYPKHVIAFKDMAQVECCRARVISVEWSASKWGKLAPVVLVEDEQTSQPLRLSGTNVSRVSAFDAKTINENKIGPGAIVVVRKRGEIIPYIEEVIKPAKKPQLPDPTITGAYAWNNTGVDLVLLDQAQDEVRIKLLTHFFTTLEVDDFNEGLIARFYEHGFDTVEKIIGMLPQDMLTIDKIQQKMADKIYRSIQTTVVNVPLDKLMYASGHFGRNFGSRRIAAILDRWYPDVLNWHKLSVGQIKARVKSLDGFQEVLALQFAQNLHQCLSWLQQLGISYQYQPKTKQPVTNHSMRNVQAYITGFRSAALSQLIAEHGGRETSTLNSKTTHLIVKDHTVTNTKVTKAKAQGIPVVTEVEFAALFKC